MKGSDALLLEFFRELSVVGSVLGSIFSVVGLILVSIFSSVGLIFQQLIWVNF